MTRRRWWRSAADRHHQYVERPGWPVAPSPDRHRFPHPASVGPVPGAILLFATASGAKVRHVDTVSAAVTLHIGHHAGAIDRFYLFESRWAAASGEQLAVPTPPLVIEALGAPEQEQCHGDAQADGGVVVDAKFEGLPQIRVFPFQPCDPVELADTDPLGLRGERQRLVSVPVPATATQRYSLTGLLELLVAVFAERLEHPKPHHRRVLLPDQNRLLHQKKSACPATHPGRDPRRTPAPRHRVRSFPRDRHPTPHQLLAGGAQLETRVDAQPQRVLPGRRTSAAAGQQGVPVGQPPENLLGRHRPQPGSCQLDRQR